MEDLIRKRHRKNAFLFGESEISRALSESFPIILPPRSIQHPHHSFIESFSRSLLFWLDMGVLKLDDKTIFSLHIGDVPLSPFSILQHNLLPGFREAILPLSVPPGLVFPIS